MVPEQLAVLEATAVHGGYSLLQEHVEIGGFWLVVG